MPRTATTTNTQQGVVAGALDAVRAARSVPRPSRHDWKALQSKPATSTLFTDVSMVPTFSEAVAGAMYKCFGEIEFDFSEVYFPPGPPPRYLGFISINQTELRVKASRERDEFGWRWEIEFHGDYVSNGKLCSIPVTNDVSLGLAAIAQGKVDGVEHLQPIDR